MTNHPIKLAKFEDVKIPEPPAWYGDNGKDDLFYCLEYNQAPFTWEDIDYHSVIREGERDAEDWEWRVVLKPNQYGDKKVYYVVGGCDYTGWDCMSWATFYDVAFERDGK